MKHSKKWSVAFALVSAFLAGCGGGSKGGGGKGEEPAASEQQQDQGQATGEDTAGEKAKDDKKGDTITDVGQLSALAPGELSRKIYDAFGADMTLVDDGKKKYDYLDANAQNFIGSISTDPGNKFASQFSIGYFLALAGLSTVVGDNYVSKLYNGKAANDCRTLPGASAILSVVAPTLTGDDLAALAAQFVAACTEDPAASVKAVIQSYSFALRI